MYPRELGASLQKWVNTQVAVGARVPSYHDEVKIALPAIWTPTHHLLFTFFHIDLQTKLEAPKPVSSVSVFVFQTTALFCHIFFPWFFLFIYMACVVRLLQFCHIFLIEMILWSMCFPDGCWICITSVIDTCSVCIFLEIWSFSLFVLVARRVHLVFCFFHMAADSLVIH